MQIMQNFDCQVKAVIVALDRKERGKNAGSAIDEVEAKFGLKVFSIIDLDDIIEYIKNSGDKELLVKIEDYRKQYGV
jgi:orotate phosphoribosyltransferase